MSKNVPWVLLPIVVGIVCLGVVLNYALSNYRMTTSENSLTELNQALLMEHRDDSARVMRETFFLVKPAYERDMIERFMQQTNIDHKASATFIFTYDDGEYPPTIAPQKRKLSDLRNHTVETITYTSVAKKDAKKFSNYQPSEITYTTVGTNAKRTETTRPSTYNRSIKGMSVKVILNEEKMYQSTVVLDTRP